jgi:hypothetical protein
MRPHTLPALVVLVLTASDASAQTLIDNSRRIDWSQAGVRGGIPDRTAICATLSPGATAAQINAAIGACTNGVVQLNAGTYTLSAGITFGGRSHVTLRGAGSDRTILRFTGSDSCGGLRANICVHGSSTVWSGNVPAANVAGWTAGYAKGSTQLTLSTTAGLTPGTILILDQLQDTADTGGIVISDAPGFTIEGGAPGRAGRPQQQYVEVTAVNGTQVTISPGVYMPNWRASQAPQAWRWGTLAATAVMNGVEDLTLDHAGSNETTGIGFSNAYNCWVKGVKSLSANRNHVWLNQTARVEVRDSYFHGTKNAASQSYGIEFFTTADDLIINNIFHHVTAPIMMGSSAGSVVAFNYLIDMYYSIATWMMAGLQGSHDAGTGMNLFEGNVANAFLMDLYHGTGSLPTLFRNRLAGSEPGKTQGNTNVVNIWAFNRHVNVVGNVLGTSGYHTVYETSRAAGASSGNPDRSIYVLGFSGIGEQLSAGIPYDSRIMSTMLRWGNYDYATRQTRWNAAEIPAGNPVPSTETLPPSLFLSSRPGWWGSTPWPAIGPDVTGGSDPAGHAHRIPAQTCYETTPKGGNGVLAFDPSACYPEGPEDTTPPAVSISAPATGTTVGGTITITASASDNVGVAGVQFKLDGVNLGSEVVTTPYVVPWNTTVTPNGSHTLTAVARDAGGNSSASAAVAVTVSNTPDTDAPSVPSGVAAAATSASRIDVDWNASTDNVGVAGYRVLRCQGAGCTPSGMVWTGTATNYSDAGLTAATTYSYVVVAFDAVGNGSAPSTMVSAVTEALPLPSTGRVAAYAFAEGTGAQTVDSSSNHNTAALSAATSWTAAGRYGNALAFEGSASFVEASDINPLTPQTEATWQAWVRLNAAPAETASVFNKWAQSADDEYLVGINPNRTIYFAWRTTGGATWGTPSYNQANGTTAIPLNTFTHIAVVRSGSTLRFYINGVLDAALTGLIDANPFRNGSATLRLGGQGRGGRNRFLSGVVDEAQIHGRALTQPEIQVCMNTALSTPPSAPTNFRIVR